MHMNSGITSIKLDSNKEVKGVVLADGTELDCDTVVMGIGVAPATKFIGRTETGIKLDQQGGIVCDPFLESSQRDIFAAGDVCSFPFWRNGHPVRIEHWNNALDQGSHAAWNMLGKYVPYGNVPLFWTRHYNKGIQYIGHCVNPDEIYI